MVAQVNIILVTLFNYAVTITHRVNRERDIYYYVYIVSDLPFDVSLECSFIFDVNKTL